MNFIKRVVAGPGDTIYIKGGHVYRNGKRESDGYINGTLRERRRPRVQLHNPDHHPRRTTGS